MRINQENVGRNNKPRKCDLKIPKEQFDRVIEAQEMCLEEKGMKLIQKREKGKAKLRKKKKDCLQREEKNGKKSL